METATASMKIEATFQAMSQLSTSQEKDKVIPKVNIDKFLDKISMFRDHLNSKTEKLTLVNNNFHQLSWLKIEKDDELQQVKDLLVLSDRVHAKLIRYYVAHAWTIRDGVAVEAMHNFKVALDDLKEYNEDLKDLFFNLPANDELSAISAELVQLVKAKNC